MADGELDTVARLLHAFYRLCATTSTDDALSENGELTDEVAYEMLTLGFRDAQRWLIDHGLDDWWRARSASALPAWSGSESTDGGRYVELSAVAPDFLRLWGHPQRPWQSALNEADGRAWGREIHEEESRRIGNLYYLRGQRLYVTRGASPPTTLYLEYYAKHPAINAGLSDASLDFPVDARRLGVAEAANTAKEEGWLPGGQAMEQKIERALFSARQRARRVARRRRQAPRFAGPVVYGNAW